MTWNSQTLADSLPAVYAGALSALAAAQKEMSALDGAISRLESQKNAAQAKAAAADELIANLAGGDSGIYYLNLAPATGLWNERILEAEGAPNRDANQYSAIICELSLTADLSAAESAKESIKKAVSTPLPPAPTLIKLPSFAPPSEPQLPAIPEPAEPPENAWASASVADLFPGTRDAVASSAGALIKDASKTLDGLTKLQERQTELQESLDAAQSLVDSLTQTGIYAFTAGPELTPTNDWYNRLIAGTEEDGRPPFNGNLYSSGRVTVIIADNYADLLSKFAKITSMINTVL